MGKLEAIVGTMLGLIAMYLLIANPKAVDDILKSTAALSIGVFGTLQGRQVSGLGVTVR